TSARRYLEQYDAVLSAVRHVQKAPARARRDLRCRVAALMPARNRADHLRFGGMARVRLKYRHGRIKLVVYVKDGQRRMERRMPRCGAGLRGDRCLLGRFHPSGRESEQERLVESFVRNDHILPRRVENHRMRM